MDNILSNIKNTQDTFYCNSKKNTFMKENQKIKCAESVLNHFSIDELLSKTVYMLDNSNKIFISYPLYKTYALSTNYQSIVDRIIQSIFYVLGKFPTFEMHIDLDSFTATALQRNMIVFQLYYDTCCKNGLNYDTNTLDRIVIYNTPSIIQSLFTLIIKLTDKSIKEKITLLYKTKTKI